MQENQGREQYFFEDETLAWLGGICARVDRAGAVFMPSLLRFPNVWVFDADERFQGTDRYTRVDVTKTVPDLRRFDMVMLDPPFLLGQYHLGRLLIAARGRPLLVSASDWCVERAGWGELFRAHGLAQVTTHFPRYRSIGNGYCEDALKRDGRTNISFFANVSFAPARRPVVLKQGDRWATFDPYDFGELAPGGSAPEVSHRWVSAHGQALGPGAVDARQPLPLRTRLARWRTRLRLFLADIF